MRPPYPLRAGAAAALVLGVAVAGPGSARAVEMMPASPPPAVQSPAKAKPDAGAGTVKQKKKFKRSKKKKDQQQSELRFNEGYRVAHALIYQRGDYEAGIAALHAIGREDDPDIANLIGYASRKLGRYEDAKLWYEKALAADPRHARTLSYYGMWHAEQGNRLKAEDYLASVRAICGTGCREYTELKGVIDGVGAY